MLLATLSVVDVAWSILLGIGISHWEPFAIVSTALLAVALGHQKLGLSPRVAVIAEWILLWLVFSVAGALLAYLAAARGGPLYDARLAALDAAVGFDWKAWYEFVVAHPLLRLLLALAYASLVAQILFSVFWFSHLGWDQRNAELLVNVILALLMTTAVFCLFPSLGPCVGIAEFHEHFVDDLIGLRNGTLPSLNIMLLKGVIAFPSFHAAMAVLFTYAHRGSPTFAPAAALNVLMIVSVPSEGGHYLVDVFGGVPIAIVALVATRVMPARVTVLASARAA